MRRRRLSQSRDRTDPHALASNRYRVTPGKPGLACRITRVRCLLLKTRSRCARYHWRAGGRTGRRQVRLNRFDRLFTTGGELFSRRRGDRARRSRRGRPGVCPSRATPWPATSSCNAQRQPWPTLRGGGDWRPLPQSKASICDGGRWRFGTEPAWFIVQLGPTAASTVRRDQAATAVAKSTSSAPRSIRPTTSRPIYPRISPPKRPSTCQPQCPVQWHVAPRRTRFVPLFRRGDHDVAVFQAFKEIEVAVRNAANAKGAGYTNSEIGTAYLCERRFIPRSARLPTSRSLRPSATPRCTCSREPSVTQRIQQVTAIFTMTAPEAARLIVFASHLFDIVERRR